MNNQSISGAMLRDLFLGGAANLEKHKAYIDSLNVFPVPDGDTGTNMSMTMQGAVKDLRGMPDSVTVSEVMDAVSNGALRSARGNSGVILSQLFRGYQQACKGKDELDVVLFAEALETGTNKAYNAVLRPKEGTILTVSRVISQTMLQLIQKKPQTSFDAFMEEMLRIGQEALDDTPNLLPVLKEAGVVDSGGYGLLTVYRGFKAILDGDDIPDIVEEELPKEEKPEEEGANLDHFSTEDIEFGYCTEFFIVRLIDGFSEADLDRLRDHLTRVGDSVVVAAGDDFVKVHVHSNCPGKILQFAMRFGELDRLKIENMREQNRQLLEMKKRNEKEYGIIAVSAGTGIDEIFRNFSVDHIISGGQTMNPSIDTIVNAIGRCNARNVFVLPNNSNIILAAQQAKNLCSNNVIVLPTKTIPQGIAAAMAFNPDLSVEENEENMNDAVNEIVSGSVTYAIRETHFNGNDIKEGDIIGIMDNDIAAVASSVNETVKALVRKMIEKRDIDDPIVNLYFGDNVEEEEAEALSESLQEEFEDAEFIVARGGQPLYYYYLSVE
ncbi:MAG: DAK2 domain-containing protein [Clostridia bacterium]|nr:DAK2 domain-containing protein [Clostridia bacterium]